MNATAFAAAAAVVAVIWVAGLTRLGVFTPDDARALNRIVRLRGYARRRSRLEEMAGRMPWLGRLQRELDLERLLALTGRNQTPLGFLSRTSALALGAFGVTLGLDAAARAGLDAWPVTPLLAPVISVAVVLGRLSMLRHQARRARAGIELSLGDSLMPLAILTDSRGLQFQDALRLLSTCSDNDALERLLSRDGWRRLVSGRFSSAREQYRLIGESFGVPLFARIADAEAASLVGVPEREVFTRLAQNVYRERLAAARAKAARAKVLVTLPVAAMLVPLLLLLGAPVLYSITSGLQGG